jgi:hypothetical protein
MVIGKILKNGKVIHEYNGIGFVYKDLEAFNKKTNKVCYVPEYSETVEGGYTYYDLYKIAKEYKEKHNIEAPIEKITETLFEDCQWQSPETIIDEWEEVL